MKVLVVKTSSLGDIIHSLPALTDAKNAHPDIQFDWLIEESFIEIPSWHLAVHKIIPIAIRRWRKNWRKALIDGELSQAIKAIRTEKYDLIIDAQGLIKSGLLTFIAKGNRAGLNKTSSKEPLASLAYKDKYNIDKKQHAITRIRQLFAQALNYQMPQTTVDYGLNINPQPLSNQPYLIMLHGTTWKTKFWPEAYWVELSQLAHQAGYQVYFPFANDDDKSRAQRIIKQAETGQLMPAMNLQQMAHSIAAASGVVGVDSGLAHLAAALNIPAITLYGATDTQLTGAIGQHQKNLQSSFGCSPCFKKECLIADDKHVYPPCFQLLPAPFVWQALEQQISQAN